MPYIAPTVAPELAQARRDYWAADGAYRMALVALYGTASVGSLRHYHGDGYNDAPEIAPLLAARAAAFAVYGPLEYPSVYQ